MMRAAMADPLSDAQLERIVKLALGKRVPIAPAATDGGDPPQATTSAVEPTGNQQVAATQGGRKKNRVARRAARAALEAEDGSPTANGGQAPQGMKSQQCPVFGCTRKHAPSDCPTFLDMTP